MQSYFAFSKSVFGGCEYYVQMQRVFAYAFASFLGGAGQVR